jgi:hypothetical protein
MNLVDLLLRLSIPVWLALLLAVAAIIATISYRYLLERRIKQLEYRLQQEATTREKAMELLQERHRKRLEALGAVNEELMGFDHAIEHLRGGNSHRGAQMLRRSYKQARELSRKYEDLLGSQFYSVVRNYTDQGERILDSSLVVANETLKELEQRGLHPSEWNALQRLVGQRIPVSEAQQRLRSVGLSADIPGFRRKVVSLFNLTEEFDAEAYQEAKRAYESLKQEILQSLLDDYLAWLR